MDDKPPIDWQTLRWGESSRLLLQAAREISKDLGHCEIICPLHLLLALLVPGTEGNRVRAAAQSFAPPWDESTEIISPGGQTPTTKRVLLRAIELAAAADEAVDAEHIRAALDELETELVERVRSILSGMAI